MSQLSVTRHDLRNRSVDYVLWRRAWQLVQRSREVLWLAANRLVEPGRCPEAQVWRLGWGLPYPWKLSRCARGFLGHDRYYHVSH
jgi:hypothetical protein